MQTEILCEISGATATLTLNRPEKRNALSFELLSALEQQLLNIKKTASVQLVILRSSGEHFCAGADLKEFKQRKTKEAREEFFSCLARCLKLLSSLPQTTLCAVQGYALAGGFGLAMACDVVVAQDDSVFGLPELRIGLLPAVIMPYIVKSCGQQLAKQLILSAERLNAQQAYAAGILLHCYSKEKFNTHLDALIKNMLALKPRSSRQSKVLLRSLHNASLLKGLAKESARWSLLEEAEAEFAKLT